MGDFSHCHLKKMLNSFYQYGNCPPHLNKTLDLCYGSIKEACKPLGPADHNTVHLLPDYRAVLKREKVHSREVKVSHEEYSIALQGCFDCTDWSVLTDSSDNIDELTDVVCSYISFSKVVKIFPNNKPWVSSALKGLIHKRKTAFEEGYYTEVKETKKD